jgi:hypothetical protein
MKHFYKLDLPINPLIDDDLTKHIAHNLWYGYTDVENYITPEVLAKFAEIELRPDLAVFVCGTQEYGVTQNLIHSDLTWQKDNWRRVPFAINWELNSTETVTTASWYDTRKCKEVWPNVTAHELPEHLKYIYGIFYPGDMVLAEQVILMDNEKKNFPALFNTDVAHSVTYKTNHPYRFVLSLRFSIDEIPSWDEAVKRFEKFIVTDV